jgi:hypothetical protein
MEPWLFPKNQNFPKKWFKENGEETSVEQVLNHGENCTEKMFQVIKLYIQIS